MEEPHFGDEAGPAPFLMNRGSQTAVASNSALCYDRASVPAPDKLEMHSEAFLHSLMRKQLRLSILSAGSFLVVLLGLPLANYFLPEFMATRIFGFTLTWLILGIGFFPAVWLIAWLFIKRSIALEEAEVAEVENKAEATTK